MTDQAMLAEMARLLAIIERYWSTHFRGNYPPAEPGAL
jgi:hypothetical protein